MRNPTSGLNRLRREHAHMLGGSLWLLAATLVVSVGSFAFWLLVIAALFTSFYSWRLIHLTFHGKPRQPAVHAHENHDHSSHDEPDAHGADAHGHHGSAYDNAHESPPVMLVPPSLNYDTWLGPAQ